MKKPDYKSEADLIAGQRDYEYRLKTAQEALQETDRQGYRRGLEATVRVCEKVRGQKLDHGNKGQVDTAEEIIDGICALLREAKGE